MIYPDKIKLWEDKLKEAENTQTTPIEVLMDTGYVIDDVHYFTVLQEASFQEVLVVEVWNTNPEWLFNG